VALDRQSIEKRDFPIGRRGYEPAAVDAHLASIAREVEALKRAKAGGAAPDAPAARQPPQSLASVASAQVQAIVEAAESSAYAIEREARDNADQTAKDAARDAQRTRDEAIERSQEHVGKVHEATALMLQRVDAMEGELSALVESLRTGANRLSADLSLLSGNMGELYAAAGRPSHADAPAVTPAPPPPAAPAAPAATKPAAPAAPIVADVVIVEESAEVLALDDVPAASDAAADGDGAAADDDDIEGARLIALNMALNGQSRDETDKYLAENFDLSDRAALLDEVYATVE
jgi:F0F1-type ATP synthase membrane subunit b/b'